MVAERVVMADDRGGYQVRLDAGGAAIAPG